MDGRGTDDIVDGMLRAGSVVESVVGVIVGCVNGGSLRCIAVVPVDELSKREHGPLSADAWRGEIGGHGRTRRDQTRSQGRRASRYGAVDRECWGLLLRWYAWKSAPRLYRSIRILRGLLAEVAGWRLCSRGHGSVTGAGNA